MRRVHELIDSVKGALSGATMDPEVELALAQEVVRVCADTRERLVRAIDLMRQGLRGEAMVIVDVRPVLTETAAALTDQAMARWRRRCAERGLPIPQPIEPDLVHELSEGVAEAEDPRFDQLMRRLRYQNLAHAPAHERLRTLWAIRKIDPGAVRDEDIRAFEQAALKELADQMRTAVSTGDFALACTIRDAMRRPEWSDRDIAVRRENVEAECSVIEVRHAARRGVDELDALEACVMRGDVAAARHALNRYQATAAQVYALGATMPHAVADRAMPLSDWVAERERLEESDRKGRERIAHLQQLALSASATTEELERVLLECDSSGLSVSDALRDAVQRRVEGERRRRVRRKVSAIGVAVMCVAAIAGGAVWWSGKIRREAEFGKLISAAQSLLDRGDIDGADRLLTDAAGTDLSAAEQESVAAAKSRVESARSEIVARDRAFEAAMENAGDPRSDGASESLGDSALRVARTSEQERQAQDWLESFRAERLRKQQAIDAAYVSAVQALANELGRVESGDFSGDQDAELTRISDELAALSRRSKVGADASAASQRVLERVQAMRDLAARERLVGARQQAEAQALQGLVERAPTSYSAALNEFIAQHSESARIPDFKAAVRRESAWRDVSGLPEVAARMPKGLDVGNADERSRAAQAIDAAIAASTSSPWVPGLRSVRELCMPQDGWVGFLDEFITLNPIAKLKMVELKDGTRHYFDDAARPPVNAANGKRVYTVMVTADGRTQSVDLNVADIAYEGPSPQSTVMEDLRPLVRGPKANASVSGLLTAMERIRSASRMDPILQASLLERLMEAGSSGAPHLESSFDEAIRAIGRLQLGGVQWMVPGKPFQRAESKDAQAVIRQSVDVEGWRQLHDRRVGEVRRWLFDTRVQPVGMLDRSPAGDLQARIAAKVTPKPPYALYAVAQGASGALRLEQVGSVAEGGRVSLSLQGVKESLPAGTLLFGGKAEKMPDPVGP